VGQVILVGSDIDRQIFGVYLADGLLDVVDHLSIYVSEKDPVLGFSRSLFSRRERLGQMWQPGELSPTVKDYLSDTEKLSIINVTEAEGTTGKGQGHGYFRSSPWASSDVLVTLRYNLPPRTRGLVRSGDSPIWGFPSDYVQRLRQTLQRANPDLYGKPRPPSVSGDEGAQPASESRGR
jgi:esterase/lipase superfamily enzyme